MPLLYLFIEQPWHLFIIQFFFGLGSALTYPTWSAIFTRHIDRGKEGMEWGIYQTLSDLSGAIAAPIGGFIAALYGFSAVMILASILGFFGLCAVSIIKNDLQIKK